MYYIQIFSPKKTGFSLIKDISQIFLTFVYLCSIQVFSADPKIFSKQISINLLSIKTLKNAPQKLLNAHNRPKAFYFTVQPRPQPTAQN